ncbi:MAG: discoidin domain-containing protein [Planctomycetaceae bacterium]|nr:discoidin domain-containing protein [Planctomycetaceae bacterium]
MTKTVISPILVAMLVCSYVSFVRADMPLFSVSGDFRQKIESDWFKQERLRFSPSVTAPMTPEDDAVGGCDGVIDSVAAGVLVGYYGFHTESEPSPWWQVRLDGAVLVNRVVIYNASAPDEAKAARDIQVLVSQDGDNWTCVYEHDGTDFVGPENPLTALFPPTSALWVRVQLPEGAPRYLHLEEIEVYSSDSSANLALHRPATQSSISQWSIAEKRQDANPDQVVFTPQRLRDVIEGGRLLAEHIYRLGETNGESELVQLNRLEKELGDLDLNTPDLQDNLVNLFFKIKWTIRSLALKNPLLDFDNLIFVKRLPGNFRCHCDEYLSYWSRPGGEICILENFKTDQPTVKSLTAGLLPPGDITRPELSYDGKRILFSYCRYYDFIQNHPDKLDKNNIPEDAYYSLYEINIDGTGLRKLTHGKYEDFYGQYLPCGDIVFLSTRRGTFLTPDKDSGYQTMVEDSLSDSFVRCGGGPERPVAIHTLHRMGPNGENIHAISPFESFEWNPTIMNDGRILYTRWDYVDRHMMWNMGLWTTFPDGSFPREYFGNYLRALYSYLEPRAIPNSHKIVFTASAHHGHAEGSLVLLDTRHGTDTVDAITRLTPDVVFPEIEDYPPAFFANPYPLSEQDYLVAWSSLPVIPFDYGAVPPYTSPSRTSGQALYLFDTFGNMNFLYESDDLVVAFPSPLKSRPKPPGIPDPETFADRNFEPMFLQDVYRGTLEAFPRGAVKKLRIMGVPIKTHPVMNYPSIGLLGDDTGKFVLGTVPVRKDGSAYFYVPTSLPIFFQALDENDTALQTMRSATYVQPGQPHSCTGCHENRMTTPFPVNQMPQALRESPSLITPDLPGSWPLDFNVLVQNVLNNQCVECHQPGQQAESLLLTGDHSYNTLIHWGEERSLVSLMRKQYDLAETVAGECLASQSALIDLLKNEHYGVKFDEHAFKSLQLWVDLYAHRQGCFDSEQEEAVKEFRAKIAPILKDIPDEYLTQTVK